MKMILAKLRCPECGEFNTIKVKRLSGRIVKCKNCGLKWKLKTNKVEPVRENELPYHWKYDSKTGKFEAVE